MVCVVVSCADSSIPFARVIQICTKSWSVSRTWVPKFQVMHYGYVQGCGAGAENDTPARLGIWDDK